MIYLNISIPFKKLIPFKSNIAEICSISLEHDVSINDSELLGDFIITGEYKNLDVNVDTMPFEHVIPFSVNLEEDINIDTLNYEIENFSYEIKNNDSLSVNILFSVTAEKLAKDVNNIFEKVDEDVLEKSEIFDEQRNEKTEEIIEVENTIKENDISIIENTNIEEDYITYHIHLVKINETIDSIAKDYKIDKEKLIELNDITNLQIGDKIIIPEIDE